VNKRINWIELMGMPEELRPNKHVKNDRLISETEGTLKTGGLPRTKDSKIQDLKLNRMQKQIDLLSKLVQELRRELQNSYAQLDSSLISNNRNLQAELHTYLSAISSGMNIQDIPLCRYIPVRVYLSNGNSFDFKSVTKALNAVLKTLDLSISDEFPVEQGSWRQQFFAKTNEAVTQPEIAERLQKIERALELQGLHQPQSQVDKNEAEALSMILSSLEKVPSAIIQVGSFVIIKSANSQGEPHVFARTLSQNEMIFIEKNQHLLKAPQELFNHLSELDEEERKKQISEGNNRIDIKPDTPA
jgi:hypothetical protein